MIMYRCPLCRSLQYKAAGPVSVAVSIKCGKCRRIVQPVAEEAGITIRTYRCTSCRREQSCANPTNERTLCIVCGTQTLQVVAEVNDHQRPARPEREAVGWSSP